MARGYLGKISAVISANTGDYVRKLNESAKETRAFANTVQRTLARASGDASKSLEGIFTPLQKVERALRAAASQKLSFRGFDGAIRDVQSLQSAIAKLTDKKTIDLVVKTSGVGSLDELKRTINVLRNQDVTIGVEGLRQQRAALGNTNNFVVSTAVRDDAARLDAVIEALERIDAERIKQISIQVEDAQLTAATAQFRRLTELSTQIGGPLAKVQSEFSGLAGTIQAQFIPALSQTQTAYEQFQQRITDGADVAGAEFRGLVADVRVLEAAIGRLRETSAAGSRLFSGEELTFVRPQVVDEFNKLAAAQQKLASAPSEVRGSPIARELLADGQVLKEQIDRISARIERLNAQGLDISVSQAGFDLAIRRLQEVRQLTEEIAAGTPSDGSAESAPLIRRAAAEREFYEESRRLREQAAADARALAEAESAPLIRRAAAERDFEEESRRLREQAAADEAAPLIRRAAAERDFEEESRRLREQATAGDPQLGTDIASPQRALDNLRGAIGSVKGQIDSLPAGLRGQFIPAIQGAEAEYRRLFSTAGATAQEIAESAARLANLEQRIATAANAARQFGGTFAQFRDSIDARAAAGGLEFLRTALSRATGDATRAAGALDRLAQAQQEAASTPGGFQRNAADLQRYANEAIEAISAVEGVGQSQAGLARGFARVGDVARGAFGNAGLAIQQAAFAFEDFFSVTGGLDQRIRAAGNNISQLGFIIGGTTGLIVGISTAIGAQLVAALIRWYNEGRTAEDQTKALNDALSRQKSLVEDLKQAFESLGDSIARRAFSQPAQQAREFERSLDAIIKKQREARESQVADLDEGVQRERANQNRINRQLQNETDPGRRVILQRDLNESSRRERDAAAAAANRRVTGDDVGAAIERAIIRFTLSGTTEQQRRRIQADVEQSAAAARRSVPLGNRPEDVMAQREALEIQIAQMRPAANAGDRAALAEIASLQQVLNSLELPLQEAIDNLANEILKSSYDVSLTIEQAQGDVADAIRRGVVGATDFALNLDKLGKELQAAQNELAAAQDIRDPVAKQAAVQAAEARVADVRRRQEAVNEGARAVRLGRTLGGERSTAALSSIEGNERLANEFGRVTASLRRAVDEELAAQNALSAARAGTNDAAIADAAARLEAARKSSDVAAAAAEVAVAMEQAVGSLRRVADSAISQSEQIVAEQQRRLTENPNDRNRQARDQAEQQLIQDRRAIAEANNALDRRRSEIQTSDPRLVQINRQLEALNQERADLQAAADANRTTVSPADAQRIADRRAELVAEQQRRVLELTAAQQRQIDAINEETAARQRAVEFENELNRRRNPQGDALAGLDLLETAGERAARELEQSLANIRAAADREVAILERDAFAPGVNQQEIDQVRERQQDAERRAREDAFRQAAPTLAGLRDSVQAALLQGPSRAELQPADVSTVEGSRELNRLLRGDDTARNTADLVQLQREANGLLRNIAQNNNQQAPIAN